MENKHSVSAEDIQSNFPPIYKPSDETEINLPMEFDAMLGRICTLLHLPVSEHAAVLENHLLWIDNVLVSFQLEEWSSHVKIYLDVGLPVTAHENDLNGMLLDRQAKFPAPFMMAVARHPETKRIMLVAFAPMTIDAESDHIVAHTLTSAVIIVQALREELGLIGESPE